MNIFVLECYFLRVITTFFPLVFDSHADGNMAGVVEHVLCFVLYYVLLKLRLGGKKV